MLVSLESIVRPTRDLIQAAKQFSNQEARIAVDTYYQAQEFRKAAGNQISAIERGTDNAAKEHATLSWMFAQFETIEKQIQRTLDAWSLTKPEGIWLRSIKGIGPVLASNFLAHLDITKAETAGAFWRFAGLDPTMVWEKGKKRPHNAALKRACYLAADSWVKLKGHEDSFYSKLYVQRKEYEVSRNEAGELKSEAKRALANKKFVRETKAKEVYLSGKLPPAHLDMRARRWVEKIFLSHLHHVMYCETFHRLPPRPYVLEHGGHAHFIDIPNYPLSTFADVAA